MININKKKQIIISKKDKLIYNTNRIICHGGVSNEALSIY